MYTITQLFQGIFLGVSLVLPGMSAGTALIILGRYRRFLRDISSFFIKPYILLGIGAVGGVLLGASLITALLEKYPDIVVSLLLGMLLASVMLVLKPLNEKKYRLIYAVPLLMGLTLSWNLIKEPIASIPLEPTTSVFLIFLAGILVSATMLLPGVSGSSLLIMMNLYDDMLYFVNHLVWTKLFIFSGGLLIGVLLFAKIIHIFYYRYQYSTAFFLAGLLIGSSRALLPSYMGFDVITFFMAGVFLVIIFSYKNQIKPD